ncbi:DUF968 domain-containing protein [bacterium]|nr:DUF968 domain-containing protein [bacterium]
MTLKFSKPGLAPKNKSRRKSAAEVAHLNWVASQPCMISGKRPVEVHHIRINGEPKDHFKTIPLHYDYHRGRYGIHDGLGKYAWREQFGYELDLLEILNERLKRSA